MKKLLLIVFIVTLSFLCLSALPTFISDQYARYEPPRVKEARFLLVGDMMFDRTMRFWGSSRGYEYLFLCISEYLKTFNVVIGNLEGPITQNASYSLGTKPGEPGNTAFTFDPHVASVLFSNNIRIVNLGNNHILDFGRAGLASTEGFLAESHIGFFGAPWKSVATTTAIGDFNVAFIGFNQFLGAKDPEETIRAIREAKEQGSYAIVFAHWGEEYLPRTDVVRDLAYRFIDAGADAVVGSHPHIVQETEIYKGKPIYYSLGNFIFDQYFSDDVKKGLGVEVFLSGTSISFKETFFDLGRDGRTCVR